MVARIVTIAGIVPRSAHCFQHPSCQLLRHPTLGQAPIAILHPNVRERERKDWPVGKGGQPADVSFGHCRQLDRITATVRRPLPRGLAESAATKANDLWGLIVHGVRLRF